MRQSFVRASRFAGLPFAAGGHPRVAPGDVKRRNPAISIDGAGVRMREQGMRDLVLSLFPGIGMLDSAFESEGFCIVRGPDVLWGGDIRKFHPPAGRFDGVIGGPPCQSHSPLANLVRARGYEPRFGNLIPEFERCVAETACQWFVMENVPQAPVPVVAGYAVHSFILNNAWLASPDGFGQEQERKRRFSFGVRGAEKAPNLMRWIEVAALLLPATSNAATTGPGPNTRDAVRTRQKPVTAMHDHPDNITDWSRRKRRVSRSVFGDGRPTRREHRHPTVTSSVGADKVRRARYTFADACRLQGLPENFLKDAPFTAAGKLKAVANGVPIPMGRAIARAVKEATKEVG